jgi:hypothetical protein
MGKEQKSFTITTSTSSSLDMRSDLNRIKKFFENNNITPLLTIKGVTSTPNDATFAISYLECSDSGQFVNFGGILVNTVTLYAVIGYNANPNSYIPIFDMVDFFNEFLFGSESNPLDVTFPKIPNASVIGNEEAKYIIESMKLDYKGFSVKMYVNSLIESSRTGSLEFSSIVMNYINDSVNKGTGGNSVDKAHEKFNAMDDDFLMTSISAFYRSCNGILELLGNEFFGKFLMEVDDKEKLDNASSDIQSLVRHSKNSYENLYLKNIKDRNIDPVFVREVGSLGFGMKKRAEAAGKGGDPRRNLAILSSGCYIDSISKGALDTVTDDKINSYNIMDILRGTDKDQDMFYSFYVLDKLKDSTVYNNFIKKLNIDTEISLIGNTKFLDNLRDYSKEMIVRRDTGVISGGKFSKEVTPAQQTFVSYSTTELLNAGKLIDKVFGWLLKNFK